MSDTPTGEDLYNWAATLPQHAIIHTREGLAAEYKGTWYDFEEWRNS